MTSKLSSRAFDGLELVDRPWFPYLCTEVEHWQWETKGDPHFNLWIAVAGRGYLACDGRTYPIEPGSFFIFSPKQEISAAHYSGQRITRFSAHFHPTRAGERLHDVDGLPSLGETAHSVDVLRKQVDRIMRIALRREDDQTLADTLYRLIQNCLGQPLRSSAGSIDPRIARAIQIFRDAPASVESIDHLAGSLGLSRSHFDRTFAAQVGQAPNQFLINCKMIHARRLIEGTQLRIGEIAQSLGYKDIYFFSRQFKAHYSTAPSQYRNTVVPRSLI
ncbi:MAG: AraC family transcriptional regulator [Puniceicoccaceae bacterium]|nr:MAG: AraC family transcriptional regulator [Puniceicoccaceae bacterium]